MSFSVFLSFSGNCKEAVNFYSEVFETPKSEFRLFKDCPSEIYSPKKEEIDLICYTHLDIMGTLVMFSDVPKSVYFNIGNNITLTFDINSREKIKSLFDRLKIGGKIKMELQKTFWSDYYGMVTDKFGIPWQFSYSCKTCC
ncbi:MAG: VOC family protein [Firmicutes bacterium]|nr:VOC family protein [Bacillota bacterium]